MTASASVVEALRRITEIYVGAPVNTEEANAYAGALQEAQDLANEALSALTPQPAEQDARGAVAWRVKDYADGWILFHHEAPARKSAEARNGALVQPLYAALTQAAPDGWVLVPVEPMPEMVAAWYRVKNGHHFHDEPAPTDTSDYAAYRAMLSASPAPPAQGAGG